LNAGTIALGSGNVNLGANGPGNHLVINADGVTIAIRFQTGRTPQAAVDQLGDLIFDNGFLGASGNVQFSLAQGNWKVKAARKITVLAQGGIGTLLIGPATYSSTVRIAEYDSQPASLTKDGPGVLSINAENDLRGGFTLLAGNVRTVTSVINPFGVATSTMTLGGGSFATIGSRTLAIANPVNVTGDTTISNTTATATAIGLPFTGIFSSSSGTTLTFLGGNVAGQSFNPSMSAGFTYAGKIAVNNNGSGTTTLQLLNTTGNDQTFSDVISGSGGISRSSSSAGTGGITYMTAANTYSGGTTLNDGSIGLAIDSTPGPNSGGPPLNNGPIGTGTLTVAPATGGLPMLFTYGGDRQVGNAINLANTTAPLIVSNADTMTLYGLITGTGSINKQGAGQLRLSPHGGNNSYSGGTTVTAGEIAFDSSSSGPADAPTAGPAGTGTITMGNGAAISALSNPHSVGNHLVFTGASATLTGGPDLTLTGNADLSGNTVMLIVNNSGQTTLSGQLSNGGLVKDGPSTLILSGVNNYASGTTVSSGTLEVQKDGGLGSGNVAVASGAILRLTAGTANTYINSGATLTLNGASPLVKLDFTGTPNSISALRFGAVQQANGTWGAIGSGANHESSLFTGTGMLLVGVVFGQINRILSIVDNGGGTSTLTLQGTPGAEYSLVSSADVTALMNTWSTVTGSTQLAPAPSGVWTFPVSAAGPRYYRLKATNPGP
jgi:autotransporter-associated beta strand protein